MKTAITYLLLFSYSTIILKPLLPYTSDIIAHVFWYKDHIPTVHSHNGKFHVHKEVSEATKNNDAEKNSGIFKKDNTTSDHITAVVLNIISQKYFNKRYYFPLQSHLPYTYLSADFPPPKV